MPFKYNHLNYMNSAKSELNIQLFLTCNNCLFNLFTLSFLAVWLSPDMSTRLRISLYLRYRMLQIIAQSESFLDSRKSVYKPWIFLSGHMFGFDLGSRSRPAASFNFFYRE